jgi:hypothetical protein
VILLRIFPPSFNIDSQEDGHSQPDHNNKEEEGISNVACHVSYQADYQRAQKGARLTAYQHPKKIERPQYVLCQLLKTNHTCQKMVRFYRGNQCTKKLTILLLLQEAEARHRKPERILGRRHKQTLVETNVWRMRMDR